MAEPIRICLADDHAVVRQGLRAFLDSQPDIEVVGEAATGAEAVALARALHPDVLLLDLMMPGMDGFEATRRIREHSPGTSVVVLTSFSSQGHLLHARQAGVLSYLLKDADAAEIAAAVRKAARHEPVISSTTRPADHTAGLRQLTNRELQVLRLIADGLSNVIIAERLVITEGTVKTHVNSLLSKLHLADRTQGRGARLAGGPGRGLPDRVERHLRPARFPPVELLVGGDHAGHRLMLGMGGTATTTNGLSPAERLSKPASDHADRRRASARRSVALDRPGFPEAAATADGLPSGADIAGVSTARGFVALTPGTSGEKG